MNFRSRLLPSLSSSCLRLLLIAWLTASATLLSTQARADFSYNLVAGWNLLGNPTDQPINVSASFGDPTKVTTVWKWNKVSSKWAFFTPLMSSAELTTYTQAKGYDLLTSIDSKEGFWVNAITGFTTTVPATSGVMLAATDLQQGWNLASSADDMTPSQLNQGLNSSLNAAGKTIVTIWAWDATSTKWKFYAPSLELSGGLSAYIDSKSYLPFSAALFPVEGFWANVGVGNAGPYKLSGQVQKGPFAIGSQVSVNELDESLNPTGKVYNVQTSDDLGNFAVASNIGTHLVEMVGDGFYMDDLTGQLAASRIQLRAIADLSLNTTPTINILTSLQGQRLRKLISQGIAYAAADTQSRNEVLTAFGIDPSRINSLTTLYSMRINGSTDADSVLLAVSAILSKMATNAAIANSTTQPAELSNYISTIAAQIAINGAITNPAITTAWKLAATQIDLVAVRSNLESYYLNRGITLVAPKFEEWVDNDASGILPKRLVPVSGLTFTEAPAAGPGQLITSNVITIAGLGAGVGAPVTVSAGTTIIKNNVAVSGTISSVLDGDTLAVRVSALDYGLTNTSTITVGTSSATWPVETRPLAPIGVFAVSGIGPVTVSWSQVIGATSYNIYWGTTAGVTTASTKITGAASPYVHTGLTAGSAYFYRVSAVNAGGENLSNETFSFLYTGGNPGGTFTATGSMATARYIHTATLLPNGKVLVTGGADSGALGSAEIYDPATSIFTATGSMATWRDAHTATLLPNGKVLVTGGYGAGGVLASAEIYDPATGSFTATGSMATARQSHTATLLPNGKVLVAGGLGGAGSTRLGSAEIYDPPTGSFTDTGGIGRYGSTATLLLNGKVLVTGGQSRDPNNTNELYIAVSSAAIYDPATGSVTATGSMATARYIHTATLLPNGKVLVAGGYNPTMSTFSSAEIYDPATGRFTDTGSMATARSLHTATLLPNGKVLVAGGYNAANNSAIISPFFPSAEIYDPATGSFTATGSMAAERYYHTATLLPNGKVLVAAGWNMIGAIASAELFQ